MKPIEDLPSMAALDLAPRFADGDGALPLLLQARPFFLQEDVGQQSQRPEAHDGERAHQLIVIQAQFLLAVSEEDFDLPARRDVREQGLKIGFQVTRGPGARLRQGRIERLPHDDDLTLRQLAHARRDDMHVDFLLAVGPPDPLVGAVLQLGGVVRQARPSPAPLCRRVCDAQPAMAPQPRRDEKVALARSFPEDFGAVPAIEQDRRAGTSHWLKAADALFHQRDLALESHPFGLTGDLLPVQLWRQRTPALQDRKSTRLNSSHPSISYAVFCLKKKKKKKENNPTNKKNNSNIN